MDKYQFLNAIGEGSFGKVYKARIRGTGQIVAIKSIKKKGKQEKDLNNLRQEIEILRGLFHENIILLLDSFETNTEFCLVTELAQGELFEILEDDKCLPEPEVRKIAQQLVNSLYYLHSQRVIHRDMKPQNILISANGIVKLCDFGFARTMSTNTIVLTSIKGTPLYMAPELVKELPYNQSVDIWSLGVILYELFVGQPPFYTNSIYSLINLIINDSVKYPENMSAEFKDFLKCLLNKAPNERSSCKDLLRHSFIRETEQERSERKRRSLIYKKWAKRVYPYPIKDEFLMDNILDSIYSVNPNPIIQPQSSKAIENDLNFEIDSRVKISKKASSSSNVGEEDIWTKYERIAMDIQKVHELKKDKSFNENLYQIFQTDFSELTSVEKKSQIKIALKVISLISSREKNEEYSDIISIPLVSQIINFTKSLVKQKEEEIICETVKTLGIIINDQFNKPSNIDTTIIKNLIPFLPSLFKYSSDLNQSNLNLNLLKLVGKLITKANLTPLKIVHFYHEFYNQKIIQELCKIIQNSNISLNHQPTREERIAAQVLAACLHPYSTEIIEFPWIREGNLEQIKIYKESIEIFESLKNQAISFLYEFDFIAVFSKLFNSEDNSSQLSCRIAVLKLILQILRSGKEAKFLFSSVKQIFIMCNLSICGKDPMLIAQGCYTLSLMLKYIGNGKKHELKEISIPASTIINLFDSSGTKEPIISVAALGLISDMLQFEIDTSEILSKFCTSAKIKTLIDLLSIQIPKDNLIPLDSSNYGCSFVGFLDLPISLIQKLLQKYQTDPKSVKEKLLSNFINELSQTNMAETLVNILLTLSPRTSLSPRGLISLLICIHEGIFNSYRQLLLRLFKENYVKSLCTLLNEVQLMAIEEWPLLGGGGPGATNLVTAQILRIFNLPYSQPTYEKDWDTINSELFKTDIIQVTLKILKYLQPDHLIIAITLLSKLILNSDNERKFAHQFVTCEGLKIINKYKLLKDDNSCNLLTETLSLLSQLSRISKDYYEPLHNLNIYKDLQILINHKDPSVKSKVCNLLGNLCRHSNYFYKHLYENQLIKLAIDKCKDPDKNTRKFACFAVGNAGFHDDSLYEELRPCVPILIERLSDPEEKTRANAAGALGNFVRNSKILCNDLIRFGALLHLLNVVKSDPGISPKRIALFSIGNLCLYRDCRREFEKLNIRKTIEPLKDPKGKDPQIIKYATRILQKLDADANPEQNPH